MPRFEITVSTQPEGGSSFTMAVEAGWPDIPDQWYRDVAAFFGQPAMIPEPGWPETTCVTGIAVIEPRDVTPNEA
jgi:hypothetical protein